MAKIEIYTWDTCPYCQRALALLGRKGVEYVQYRIDGDDAARQKMVARTGGPRTVPQIFVDDTHYGGCDDIHMLDANGELDAILGL